MVLVIPKAVCGPFSFKRKGFFLFPRIAGAGLTVTRGSRERKRNRNWRKQNLYKISDQSQESMGIIFIAIGCLLCQSQGSMGVHLKSIGWFLCQSQRNMGVSVIAIGWLLCHSQGRMGVSFIAIGWLLCQSLPITCLVGNPTKPNDKHSSVSRIKIGLKNYVSAFFKLGLW